MNGLLAAAAAVLTAACSTTKVDAAAPSGYGWNIGKAGWSLEQFGPNVTILRSLATAEPPREPILFLSCSFGSLRLRITLPEPLPGRLREDDPGGAALVRERTFHTRAVRGMLGRFSTPGPQQLEFRDGPEGGIVREIVQILQARKGEIEMLISFGTSSRLVNGRLVAYSFQPILASSDDPMLAHVASACISREKPLNK